MKKFQLLRLTLTRFAAEDEKVQYFLVFVNVTREQLYRKRISDIVDVNQGIYSDFIHLLIGSFFNYIAFPRSTEVGVNKFGSLYSFPTNWKILRPSGERSYMAIRIFGIYSSAIVNKLINSDTKLPSNKTLLISKLKIEQETRNMTKFAPTFLI